MAESDPTRILLAHHRWANRLVLEPAARLDDAALARTFEMGCVTLLATYTHLLGAVRAWTDALEGREPPRERLEEVKPTMPELLDLAETVADEFDAAVLDRPLDEIITRVRRGRRYAFTRGGVLIHVTTHGVHHRAQCLNMMRHLGVDPLPDPSVLSWMVTQDPIP